MIFCIYFSRIFVDMIHVSYSLHLNITTKLIQACTARGSLFGALHIYSHRKQISSALSEVIRLSTAPEHIRTYGNHVL
jgi:hypothetical protein